MDSATIKIEAHCILDGRKFYFNIAGQIGRRAGPGYLLRRKAVVEFLYAVPERLPWYRIVGGLSSWKARLRRCEGIAGNFYFPMWP